MGTSSPFFEQKTLKKQQNCFNKLSKMGGSSEILDPMNTAPNGVKYVFNNVQANS